MRTPNWLRPLANRLARKPARRPSPRPSFRPCVESLEDRAQPSAVLVSSPGPYDAALVATQNSVTPDGRYVAYTGFVNDFSNYWQIYVYDRLMGTNELVSVAADGTPSDSGGSYDASISADGRYIAFRSAAYNLGANGSDRIFVHDRQTGGPHWSPPPAARTTSR